LECKGSEGKKTKEKDKGREREGKRTMGKILKW